MIHEPPRFIGRVSRQILAALFAVLLTSCYEDHTEVWLQEDGSGRVESTIIAKGPALVILGQSIGDLNSLGAQQFIEGQPGIRLISASMRDEVPDADEKQKEDLTKEEMAALAEKLRKVFELEYEFESLEALRDLKIIDAENLTRSGSSAGITMDLRPGEDRTLSWRSEIVGPTATGVDGKKLFEGSSSTMIVHFPRAILESNADEISADRMSATWKVDMAGIINGVAPLHATLGPSSRFSLPVSPRILLIVVGALIALGISFLLGRRWGRGQRESAQAEG
jgi:hypothetical protein